jgi:CBS domain-containing membrane protein
MLNVLIILVAAIAFNALFPWRRYPAALVRQRHSGANAGRKPATTRSHTRTSSTPCRRLDSFIDISEEDLLRIYSLATGRHREVMARAAAAPVSPSGPP